MEERNLHVFWGPLGLGERYCVRASSESEAIKIIESETDFRFNYALHVRAVWKNDEAFCKANFIMKEDWKQIMKLHNLFLADPNPDFKSSYLILPRPTNLSNAVNIFSCPITATSPHKYTIYMIGKFDSTELTEQYGATCSKCGELFPYAVKGIDFKCWGCKHNF